MFNDAKVYPQDKNGHQLCRQNKLYAWIANKIVHNNYKENGERTTRQYESGGKSSRNGKLSKNTHFPKAAKKRNRAQLARNFRPKANNGEIEQKSWETPIITTIKTETRKRTSKGQGRSKSLSVLLSWFLFGR